MADTAGVGTLSRVTTEPVSRQERKQRTRQALLDAALAQLADRPFAGLSLREVTKHAGLVPTAFYRHFSSMDELGVALVEQSMRTLRRMIRSARADPSAFQRVITASVRTLHTHVRAHEADFRFLTRERYAGSGPVAQAVGTELRLFTSELAVDLVRFDYLRDWRTEDVHLLAELIVNTMLSTVFELLEVRAGEPGADEAIVRTARRRLRMIVLGVAGWRSE